MKAISLTKANEIKDRSLVWPVWQGAYAAGQLAPQPELKTDVKTGETNWQELKDYFDSERWVRHVYAERKIAAATEAAYTLPERVPNLHRLFARVRTESDCVSFANEYGLLLTQTFAEEVGHWQCQAELVRFVLHLNSELQRRDRTCLAQLVRRSEHHVRVAPYPSLEGSLPLTRTVRRSEQLVTVGPFSCYTGLYSGSILQGKSDAECVEYHMLHVVNQEREKLLASRLVRTRSGVLLLSRPRNLLGVIWQKTAEEITGSRYGKTCQKCGKSFKPHRRDALWCSPACSQAAYRARKEEPAAPE